MEKMNHSVRNGEDESLS